MVNSVQSANDLELTDQFISTFNEIEKTGKNIFVTGKAGTGKSTLLRYFRDNTAKNVVSTKARKSEIYDNDTTDQLLSESATTSENPENILQAEQLRSEINKALQNLPEDIRVTLSLREFDGLSYEEIAKVLECPIGTVRSRIHKGREMLDQTFSKYDMSNFEARKI